jgi:hypothetical protein
VARPRQAHRTHALLAPVCVWFTEGLGTPVLQDAKALLDELIASSSLAGRDEPAPGVRNGRDWARHAKSPCKPGAIHT